MITVGVTTMVAALPSSSSPILIPLSPQQSLIIPVIKSSSIVRSQPTSSVTTVSDAHTSFSCGPVTSLSVVGCLPTNNDAITSVSTQVISSITTIAGM